MTESSNSSRPGEFTLNIDSKTPAGAGLTERWNDITDIAVRGLRYTYATDHTPLPHTVRIKHGVSAPRGHNPRYGLIALLGLTRNRRTRAECRELADRIWERLRIAVPRYPLTPGDHGLGLWACAADASCPDELRTCFSPTLALAQLREHGERSDSVELAWLLLGGCHALQARHYPAATAEELAERSLDSLVQLHHQATGLFWRHRRPGAGAAVSRRIPCFAHQIYPLMALAVAARVLHSSKAAALTADLARRLCRTQGPQGQWSWLYDAHSGQVVERYPVFSVHQDGMAPMALLEAQQTTGIDHSDVVRRSLNWIYGNNELSTTLISPEGLILRDIHIRGVGRLRRMIRGLKHLSGLTAGQISGADSRNFTHNRECRPYHLGWALYAAALWHSAQAMTTGREAAGEHEKRSSAVVGASKHTSQREPLHAFDGTESKGLF